MFGMHCVFVFIYRALLKGSMGNSEVLEKDYLGWVDTQFVYDL